MIDKEKDAMGPYDKAETKESPKVFCSQAEQVTLGFKEGVTIGF